MDRQIIGWREWLALPELGIPHIKAKVDTGARTSALHTFSIETYRENGIDMVRFGIHPYQKRSDITRICEAPVIDERWVTDSGGHRELRLVISTTLQLGSNSWPAEITLTNRETMRFRMLLGRTAIHNGLLVNPNNSFCLGRPPGKQKQPIG